ncbi:MAG: DNA methyltransferase [Alphaproteobacteria bacterium]|nr:DNA methyltransferase [Alphaproteobacteria bacterium]
MTNLSKQKRDTMIAFLEQLKKEHSDDKSIRAFNEIENHLREKKYGLVWEEHSEEVDDMLKENIPVLVADKERRLCKDENLPWNFIIEGDNLQALYLLEKTHKGKIDCIYIDPPYNTGARDWKYNNDYVDVNDSYRHSKWLSMMKSRLMIAKELLNPENSVLICTIDEKEYLHLGCLFEEIFPNAKIQMVSSIIKDGTSMRLSEFSRCNEYIFFLRFGSAIIEKEINQETNKIPWRNLIRSGTGSNNFRKARPNSFYPIYVDKNSFKIVKIGESIPMQLHPNDIENMDGCITILPVKQDGTEMVWGLSSETLKQYLKNGYAKVVKNNKSLIVKYITKGVINDITTNKIIVEGIDDNGGITGYYSDGKAQMPQNQWDIPSHNATQYGTNLLKNIIGHRFTFPKSLYAVRDCLNHILKNKKNATIIDFFAGSGTTGHAVNLLNAQDGGKRTFIMVTNNEVSEDETKEFAKRGIRKGDKEWEEKGIAKYVTWPRTVCSIDGVNIKGEPLKGDYLDSNIPMADGFETNVKFFKCEWTPRKPEDYLLSNALGLHIKEMIELQNAIEIDNVKNVLILNKDDFNKIILDDEVYNKIENIWLNQNIVLNAKELKMIQAKGFKYIPREFFGQELRENAE